MSTHCRERQECTRIVIDIRENGVFIIIIYNVITQDGERNSRIVTREGVKNVGVEQLRPSATQINFQVQKLFAFWLGSMSRARSYYIYTYTRAYILYKTVMRRNNSRCLNVYINISQYWRAVIFRSLSAFGTAAVLIYVIPTDIITITLLIITTYLLRVQNRGKISPRTTRALLWSFNVLSVHLSRRNVTRRAVVGWGFFSTF